MKSVLHKSFKAAKCKTSLKLAVSRIKLLKNKKEVVLRQLKREVAQLLESGQDQTARIRVEHVIREEKMMGAYDLVEIYCELIVARLPIIESQKNCPIDLKEAVSSVIFASPRCADIPELMDVRKLLTAKYGRDFVAAATELRPECGVSRTLVEKLSAVAPDGKFKVKVLTDIANEHNIKWEPDWFKDKDLERPEDLLNGPGTARAGRIHVESPSFQSSNVEWRHGTAPNIHEAQVPEVKLQSFAPDISASQLPPVKPQNYAPADIGASEMPPTGSFYPEGVRQNFNLEFKDATAAAQAAAESAERASMAARAAVELSTRGQNMSYSSIDMPSSSILGGDEGNKVNTGATLQGEHVAQNLKNNSFHGRSPKMPDQQRYANERDSQRGGFGEMSLKEDYDQIREQYTVDRPGFIESGNYSHLMKKNIRVQSRSSLSSQSSSGDQYDNEMPESPLFDEPADMRSGLGSSRAQSGVFDEHYSVFSNNDSERHGNTISEDAASGFYQGNTLKEEREVGEHSHLSSYSSAFYDEKDDVTSRSDSQKYDTGNKGPFVEVDHGSIHLEAKNYDSRPSAGVVFDESDSDGDDCMLSTEKKDNVQSSSVQPTGGKWGMHSTFSSKSMYQQELSESFKKTPLYSQLVEPVPLSFDDSDGHDSESEEEQSEEELKKSEVGQKTDKVVPGISSWDPEPLPQTNPGSIQSSYRGNRTLRLSSESLGNSRHQKESNVTSSPKLAFPDLSSGQAVSVGYTESKSSSSDLDHWSSSSWENTEKDKQSTHSPQLQASNDSRMDSFREDQSNLESSMELSYRPLTGGLRHKGYRIPPYVKDTASSQVREAEESEGSDVKFAGSIHEPESHVESRKFTRSSKPETLTDDSSEDDVPMQSPIRKGRPVSSLSRRTKAPFPRAGAGSTSSPRMSFEASSPTDDVPEIDHSSPNRYASEAIPKDRTTIASSGLMGGKDNRLETLSRTLPEEGSSAIVRGKTNPPKEASVAGSSPEVSKNASSNMKAPSAEDSVKKASHVHPNLPDYDSLAAHLLSLRMNRK